MLNLDVQPELWTNSVYLSREPNVSTEPTDRPELISENPNCGKVGMFSLALPLAGPLALRHPVFSTGGRKYRGEPNELLPSASDF